MAPFVHIVPVVLCACMLRESYLTDKYDVQQYKFNAYTILYISVAFVSV